MAGMKKLSAREKREKDETNTALIYAALNNDMTTRSGINKATGVKLHEINNLFLADKDLYAEYVVRRRTIADTAADNIVAIVNDKLHPHHFAASKYIAAKYRTDLDVILTPVEEELIPEMGGSKVSPVKIVFGKVKPVLIEEATIINIDAEEED